MIEGKESNVASLLSLKLNISEFNFDGFNFDRQTLKFKSPSILPAIQYYIQHVASINKYQDYDCP